jgi:hypothetical protein
MDQFHQITETASYAVAIFGNPARGDFALFDLTKGTPFPVEDIQREIAERAFCFCGVMGIVQGVPRTALAEPLGEYTVTALSRAFIERVGAAVTAVEGTETAVLAAPVDDSIGWCERLYWLPDTRD